MRRESQGFTLIELMVVVAIVGMLTATAIPTYRRYLNDVETVEVQTNLGIMYDAALLYYATDHTPPGQINPVPRQYPVREGSEFTPDIDTCCDMGGRCEVRKSDWELDHWQALGFAPSKPFRATYRYAAQNRKTSFYSLESLDIRARFDVDCDGEHRDYRIFNAKYLDPWFDFEVNSPIITLMNVNAGSDIGNYE